MNRRKALTRYLVRSSFEGMFSGKKSKLPKTIFTMVLVIFLMSFPFMAMVFGLYEPFKAVGQEGMLLSLLYFSGSTVILLFGIFTILNIFYFSNDIEVFLPMPFKSTDIIAGKFLAAIINMCVYSSVLILPLIAYGIMSKGNILYYIYMIISLMLVIVFPLIIASLICTLMMRLVPLTKHKDAFKMITGCLALVLVVLFNVFMQKISASHASAEQMASMLAEGNNSGIKYISGFFIVNRFSSEALINCSNINGLINILVAIIISIGLFIVYYILGSKMYLKSIIGLSETYSKRKSSLADEKTSKKLKTNSPIKAIVLKDLKVLLRTPQFFINCIAMLIYVPAIFIVCFFTNGTMDWITKLLTSSDPKSCAMAVAIIFLATSLFVSGGRTASTSLSREGKDFMVSMYIPIDYKIQVNAKIITTLLINCFVVIVMAILLIALKVNVFITILSILVSASTVFVISLSGMYFDFRSPNLNWEDEKQMFKGDYVPMVTFFVMFLIGGAFIGLSFLIRNYVIISIVIILVNIIFSFIFYKKINKAADKIYNN